jgi:dUTP pyrophosphatase
MNPITVPIQIKPGCEDLPLPVYMSEGAAGMDLYAALDGELTLQPGERALIPTGIFIALPPGYEAQVRPRSGLAHREGITMLNSPGTIDSDYRGEVAVIAVNLGANPVTLRRGDRIAQMIVAPVVKINWQPVAELPASGRGPGGFGHTGK